MSKSASKTDNNKGKVSATPGQLLRRAREARKLSIESVAERMHLAVDIIHALENGDYGKLPAPTYIRGYLRAYATYVGIDGDKLVEEYNLLVGKLPPELVLEAIPSASQPGKKPDSTIVILSVVVVVAILALIGWLSSEETGQSGELTTQQQEQTTDRIEHVLPEQEALIATMSDNVPDKVPAQVSTPEVSVDEPPVTPAQEILLPVTVREEPEPVAIVDVSPPVPVTKVSTATDGQLRLSLAFDGSSWVEVHDANNKRLLMRLARAGSRYNVTGEPPLSVLLGNARVVRLMVNDKTFSHQAYIRGKIARFDIKPDSE